MTKNVRVAFALLCAMAITPVVRAQDAVDRLDMKAHAAFNAQKYDIAIKYWSEALKIDPNNATDWFNRGTAYADSKDPEKAIADYGEAIRLDPTDTVAHRYRAELYKAKREAASANGETDTDDTGKELADYTEIIRIEPDAASYITRGVAYRQVAEFDKAAADFTDAIRLDPKKVDGYQLRANVFLNQGQMDKAIADYDQLVLLQPNSNNYRLRGEAYLKKQDWDKAIADANEAIRIAPNYDDAIALRGNAWSSKGEYDKALEDFNHLMDTNPNYAEGFNAEAWLYATCPKAEIRNGARALELAQKACELSGWNDGGFIDTLAAAEAETGKWDDAVKHQKQAVEVGKAMKEDEWRIKDYASRIPLYEQKKPYREEKK